MSNWIETNQPVVAAVVAALTPVLIALATGDLQAALSGWNAAAEVLIPVLLAAALGWLTGSVAQRSTTPLADPRDNDGNPLRASPEVAGAVADVEQTEIQANRGRP